MTLALRHPGRYRSLSAFAPIVAPSQVPWGEKAFARYLGDDRARWRAHDACALLADGARFDGEILVDQGRADKFLAPQLQPERLDAACKAAAQPLRCVCRCYDHSYGLQSFVQDHWAHEQAWQPLMRCGRASMPGKGLL